MWWWWWRRRRRWSKSRAAQGAAEYGLRWTLIDMQLVSRILFGAAEERPTHGALRRLGEGGAKMSLIFEQRPEDLVLRCHVRAGLCGSLEAHPSMPPHASRVVTALKQRLCAEIPRRAHGGQRRMRLSMGVGHLHGAPWPCSSDMHHMVGSRAVQRGPADLKSVRQENDGARMGARDLRASQGIVVSRYYPNLHRGIRAPVIACERADE